MTGDAWKCELQEDFRGLQWVIWLPVWSGHVSRKIWGFWRSLTQPTMRCMMISLHNFIFPSHAYNMMKSFRGLVLESVLLTVWCGFVACAGVWLKIRKGAFTCKVGDSGQFSTSHSIEHLNSLCCKFGVFFSDLDLYGKKSKILVLSTCCWAVVFFLRFRLENCEWRISISRKQCTR